MALQAGSLGGKEVRKNWWGSIANTILLSYLQSEDSCLTPDICSTERVHFNKRVRQEIVQNQWCILISWASLDTLSL